VSRFVLSRGELARALLAGLAVGVLTALVMVPANLTGVAPMPEPPSLKFAETVLGTDLPKPVGVAFHLVYTIAWTVIFVALFKDAPTLGRAMGLALALWVVVLVVFFPINGWGIAGLVVGPQMIVGALVPHLLFGVVLWAACRVAFGGGVARA